MTPGGRTWRGLLGQVEAAVGSRNEARRIVERAAGWDGAELVLHLDDEVPERAVPFVDAMVARRRGGEPLQYVLGRWGFRRLELLVDRRVLIPRPETEWVVETVVEELARLGRRTPAVADLGTGSGAIALSVADEVSGARVWASDVDAGALAVARANLAGLGSRVAPRVTLCQGSWFEALPPDLRGGLDVVVANPPYVAAHEPLPPEVADWEPREALVAGPGGLEAVTEIVTAAPAWLTRPGVAVVELAPHQADEAVAVARGAGFGEVRVRPDLQGRLRVLIARV